MTRFHSFFGGKTHFIVWVCLFLGSSAFAVSVWQKETTGLSAFLTFLVTMSGVQAGRSALEDFKSKDGPQ